MVYRVCVIGLGYIGTPTAAVIAASGHRVFGVDVNQETVNTIKNGKIPIEEPKLGELLKKGVDSSYLTAHLTPCPADVFIICVPTPVDNRSHCADLSYIEAAIRSITPFLKPTNLVLLESTSPVGTTLSVCNWIRRDRPDLKLPDEYKKGADLNVAYSPERVIPGNTLYELIHNDRIIGGVTQECAQKSVQFYQTFVKGKCLPTVSATAELIKLAENSFRDVNIAFANELDEVCQRFGISVHELIRLANHHPRVNILHPGIGVGGHCIAVDPWFIIQNAVKKTSLMRTARAVNDAKPLAVAKRIIQAVKQQSPSSVVGCLGLSYKPNIDDFRNSPAIEVIKEIRRKISNPILVSDPYCSKLPYELQNLKNVTLVDYEEAIKHSQVITFLVAHTEFKSISLKELKGKSIKDFVDFLDQEFIFLQENKENKKMHKKKTLNIKKGRKC